MPEQVLDATAEHWLQLKVAEARIAAYERALFRIATPGNECAETAAAIARSALENPTFVGLEGRSW